MQVTIIEMAHHFLYLPVQYAVDTKCFGSIPDEYEIRMESADPKTDQAAYVQLMRGDSADRNEIYFAVADPAVLFHDRDTHLSPPVVLAGLITNAAFWAVNRRSHTVRFLSDLANFRQIIAFPEGTTSHGIATRIYRDANKVPSILTVEPAARGELVRLTSSEPGTMALTPDILGIDALLARDNRYYIDLALGATPEYNNVLVTALLSRLHTVNEHRELVRCLLTAIQRAMLLVRFADPRIIAFARRRSEN